MNNAFHKTILRLQAENKDLKERIAKLEANQAKRDLEQQAKSVESVRKYCVKMMRKRGSKWVMVDAIWYLQDTEKELRKQAEAL